MFPLLIFEETQRGRSIGSLLTFFVDGDMAYIARYVRTGTLSTEGCIVEMKENACGENGMKDLLGGWSNRADTCINGLLRG